jgi:Trypsin-like peptidase domain
MAQSVPEAVWRSRLARAVVSIELEPNQHRGWDYGTGFFVTPRVVLTACHNVESENIPLNKKEVFSATYRDQSGKTHALALRWVSKWSSPKGEHDTAVLLLEGPEPPDLEPLRAALLPTDGPTSENVKFLAGRDVMIFGYPVQKKGQEERLVKGALYETQPLKPSQLNNPATGKLDKSSATLELVVVGENAHGLPGISGAPIVDIASETVIGIQHAYDEDCSGPKHGTHFVYGSPLNLLIERWPEFQSSCGAIRLGSRPNDPGDPTEKLRSKLSERLKTLEGKTFEHDGDPIAVLEYLARGIGSGSPSEDANLVDHLANLLLSGRPQIRRTLREAAKHSTQQGRDLIATRIREVGSLVIPHQIPADLWDRLRCDRLARAKLGKAAGLITAEAVAARESGAAMHIEKGNDGTLVAPFQAGRPAIQGVPGAMNTGPYDAFVRELWHATGFDGSSPDVVQMVSQLKGFYKSWEEDSDRPPFLFVKLPQQYDDREAWIRALAEFLEKVEHVVIFEECGEMEFHELDGSLKRSWRDLHSI